MSSLNKAMIIGRLGVDPEVRYTQSNTAVANMSVATSEKYKDGQGEIQEKTEWHKVVVWGKLAEICEKYLKKGSQAYFEGPIQTRSWEDKEGTKKYVTEIRALNMVMLDSKSASSNNQTKPPGVKSSATPPGVVDDDVDDDLPF